MDPDVSEAEVALITKMDRHILSGDCAMLVMLMNYWEQDENVERLNNTIKAFADSMTNIAASAATALARLGDFLGSVSPPMPVSAVVEPEPGPNTPWERRPLSWVVGVGEGAIDLVRDAWANDRPLLLLGLYFMAVLLLLIVVVIIREISGTW